MTQLGLEHSTAIVIFKRRLKGFASKPYHTIMDLNSSFKTLSQPKYLTNSVSDTDNTETHVLKKEVKTKQKFQGFLRTISSATAYSPLKALSKFENLVISINPLSKIANTVANILDKVSTKTFF